MKTQSCVDNLREAAVAYTAVLADHPVFQSLRGPCQRVLGMTAETCLAQSAASPLYRGEDAAAVAAVFHDAKADGLPYHVVYRLPGCRREQRWLADTGCFATDAGGAVIMTGCLRDVTRAAQLEQASLAQREVFELMTNGAGLDTLLHKLVVSAEAIIPGMRCSVLLVDAKSNTLRNGMVVSLPDWFRDAVDGLPIGENVGSCGAAAHSGQRVIAADLLEHPNWKPFRQVVDKLGLRACWSEPIKSNGVVLGTFAMYYPDPAEPSPAELALIGSYAHVVGIALSHQENIQSYERTRRDLDAKIEHQSKELQLARKDLIEAAHLAGMAEIATSLLHNVGNILNSFRVASHAVQDILGASALGNLERVLTRLQAGSKVPEADREQRYVVYLNGLKTNLEQEHQELLRETGRMFDCGERILEIVQAQQQYSHLGKRREYLHLAPLIEDALNFLMSDADAHEFSLSKALGTVAPVYTEKIKLINTLNWLLAHCRTALLYATRPDKRLHLALHGLDDDWIELVIGHNGQAVEAAVVRRMLAMGGSVAGEPHDLGLHMAANYMQQMEGTIEVRDNPEDGGITFVLRFPVKV